MSTSRNYSDFCRIGTFEERYQYLKLSGEVGDITFGHDRWMNQQFYTSTQWRQLRQYVITRDEGCDLAWLAFPIHKGLYIHHMNPMTPEQLAHGEEMILDPEFLITCSHRTHNAIHYGDESQLPRELVVRRPGDTTLWRREP